MTTFKKIILFASLLISSKIAASNTTINPLDFFEKYKLIAIQEKFAYKIPASITLAQAYFESGYGNSNLALEANNFFGIKCHSDWNGKKFYKDDETADECFRVYDKVEDSFEDHALFLSTKSRYAFLFKYGITDYKSWAKGLKEAGYATNPEYPKKLIDIIERYNLSEYDKITSLQYNQMLNQKKNETIVEPISIENLSDALFLCNEVKYIIVQENETILDIAKTFDVFPNQLYKYNDLKPSSTLIPGTRVFIQPKRKKGDDIYHIVRQYETYWSISQLHGIKLSSLYKLNGIKEGDPIVVGTKLNLRKRKKEN